MENFGFIRVAAATPTVHLGHPRANAEEMKRLIDRAAAEDTAVLVFPELGVTGYSCGDLFGQPHLLAEAERAVAALADHTLGKRTAVVAGAPVPVGNQLYDCALVIYDGAVKGIVPKIHIPQYGEFYEGRHFASGAPFAGAPATVRYAGGECPFGPNQLFRIGGVLFAAEVCEDVWVPLPPSTLHALAGAQFIVNLSAGNEVVGKDAYRRQLLAQQSAHALCGYVYAAAGFGESTQDLVFAGPSMIWENGELLAAAERFSLNEEGTLVTADLDTGRLTALRRRQNTFEGILPDGRRVSPGLWQTVTLGEGPDTDFEKELKRRVEAHPFVPQGTDGELEKRASEIFSIQVQGLVTRLRHVHARTAVLGISGGLDSTLALLVTVRAFDRLGWERSRILAVTMPGFGTTDRTLRNARGLMDALGVHAEEISIAASVRQHFADIGHDPSVHDTTYENAQARERTQILMDLANQSGGLVIGTGDLSELALGWATYNGDHMSMYGVNAGVPKTLVRHLVRWAAEQFPVASSGRGPREILLDILDTPVSPELIPADAQGHIVQVTEDLVGPYELHDFFLYQFVRCGASPKKIAFLARKAFAGTYDGAVIDKWLKTFLKRFFAQQFKRSCLPDGPKVGSVGLSPRGDWRMPSDAESAAWTGQMPQ